MNSLSSESTSTRQSVDFKLFLSHSTFQIIFIAFLATILIFVKLGGNGLANYDDCFYAQKAKEILHTHDWMTLHYTGRPAFENPPFYMWLTACSYSIFGVNEYAAKFPSALLGVSTIVLIYFFARTLYNPWIAFTSSIILSTSFIFVRYARHAMVDVTLSFFVCLAMAFLLLALRNNARYFLLWGISISACVLTKSILGFFPLVITVLFMLLTKRWKTFLNPYFLAGCSLIFLLGCSWYLHEYLKFHDEFLHVHFSWLIIQRGFSSEAEPWYNHLSYAQDLLRFHWPWLPFLVIGLVQVCRKSFHKDETALLLLLWVLTIFITMSMMATRVLWYIMPIFPAAAIISADAINRLLSERGKRLFQNISIGIGTASMIILVATPVQIEAEREKDVRIIAPYVKHFAENGDKVVAYKYDYYGLNNALLFYSDHAASPSYHKPEEISRALETSETVLCVVSVSDYDEIAQNVHGFHIIKKTDEIILISNKPLDTSNLKTLR